MPKIKEAIGTYIKTARAEKNISQHDLAMMTGIDRSYIANIELGKRNLSIIILYKISEALSIKPSELIKKAGY